MTDLPQQLRVYSNYALNGAAWRHYRPRAGDIVIATSLKAGTTWMQSIVEHLIFQHRKMPAPVWRLSPWLERRAARLADTLDLLEAQAHRRCIKTHLPLDALPYFPAVKYIYVGRDGRDLFMSLWNHHRHLKPETLAAYRAFALSGGQTFPPCQPDIHGFFAQWIEKSWFPWEHEGFPYWSPLYHLQSWWAYRHLPNLLFVHFNDLLADLDGEMRRIAAYLEIPVNEANWPELVDSMTFSRMKESAEKMVSNGGDFIQGGAQRFLYQGCNGRWHDVLTPEELDRYQSAVARQLDAESGKWLETGTSALVATPNGTSASGAYRATARSQNI